MAQVFPIFAHYVHNLDPFAVHFPEGWFLEGIRWYGLAYLAGFLIGLWLLNFYYKKNRSPLGPDETSSLLTYMIFGIIIGGRMGYMLFYDFGHFIREPISALGVSALPSRLRCFQKSTKWRFSKFQTSLFWWRHPGYFWGGSRTS